jgi:hypothetical protein
MFADLHCLALVVLLGRLQLSNNVLKILSFKLLIGSECTLRQELGGVACVKPPPQTLTDSAKA